MAPTKSPAESKEAEARGWRPFEVLPLNRPVPSKAIWCPSDKLNSTSDIPCEKCGMCSGSRGGKKRVVIYVHGSGASQFGARRQRLSSGEVIKRRSEGDYPLVRLEPDLHVRLKKASRRCHKSMRVLVGEALLKSGILDG